MDVVGRLTQDVATSAWCDAGLGLSHFMPISIAALVVVVVASAMSSVEGDDKAEANTSGGGGG